MATAETPPSRAMMDMMPRRRIGPEDILCAVRRNDLAFIERITRKNPLVIHIHGPDGCTAPLLACKLGHLDMVKFFLDNGASVDDRDRDPKRQGNALHYAAWGGHLEMVKWLLEQGASLDDVDIVGNTALLYAVYGGHRHVVDELLARGRSLQERNSKNHTALLQAACGGHLDLVEWLLDEGFSVDECDLDGNTSLLFAAWGGHLDLIHFLLTKGSSLTEQNQNGHSIFLSAANGGRVEIVEWLLQNGFSLKETNNNGDTALLLAAYGGHQKLVKRLLKLGASLTDRNACGFSPLLSAANGGQLEMAEWLLDHGASLTEADYDGYTSLILAACGGNIDLVRFFIRKGAVIKERNSNGDTALLLASYCGHRDLVDWLLKNGSTLDEKNETGMGALISAANGGVPDVVELLIQRIAEAGPDCADGIESTDEGGYTPLLLAAQRGHLEVVKLLAQYGANVQAVTTLHQNNAITLSSEYPEVQAYITKVWNWTPLQIAVENNDFKRVFALVQAGVDTCGGYTGPVPLEIALARTDEHARAAVAGPDAAGAAVVDGGAAAVVPDVAAAVMDGVGAGAVVLAGAGAAAAAAPAVALPLAPIDPKIVSVLKQARLPWSPSRHMLFPAEARMRIRWAMTMIPRVSANERLPLLPTEMWMHIMSFIAHRDPKTSQSRSLQIGWVKSTLASPAPKRPATVPTTPDLSELDMCSDDEDELVDSEGRRARNSTSKLRCRALFPEDGDVDMSEEDSYARSMGVVSFRDPQRSSGRVQ
eukprot:m.159972 g.159972  ORF g.159972 m.159972 type:complete len:764 (+) comp11885_c0_seq1:337-2628(+)